MTELQAQAHGLDDNRQGAKQHQEKLTRPPRAGSANVARGDVGCDVLLGALRTEQAKLAHRVRSAIQSEVPSYRLVVPEALAAEVDLELGQVLRSAGGARASLSVRDCVNLAAVGEERARQGIPVDDLLRAWRIGIGVVVGYAREVGQCLGVDDARVLEFVQSALTWSDMAMVETTRAHRRGELARAADVCHANFVRGALLGTIPRAELRIQAEMYGLDPAGEYIAVRARLGEDVAQCQVEQALGLHDSTRGRCGLCALVDDDAAGFLNQAPPKDVDGVVGFGPPRSLERLAESYRSAARALVTAEACGFRGSYDIASLGLRPAVALDAEVGELLRRRYLEPLAAASSAGELIATLRAYLACGMHVERTATKLFVHQNTVRYRIGRFEELTRKSLGDTEVLLEVWWALELSAMHL
ncbi:PucR family transcriptional regulator [Mycobacterium sp. MUNTM1]